MPNATENHDAHAALLALVRRLAHPLAPEDTEPVPPPDPLPGIRAVLFDVYGTLLISASGDVGALLREPHVEPLAEALREAGLTGRIETAAAQAVRRFHQAISDTHASRKAAGIEYPEVDVRALWGSLLRALAEEGLLSRTPVPSEIDAVAIGYEMRINPVWPMPGAETTLREISRRGLLLGLVSNAQFYTPVIIEALFQAPPTELGLDPGLCAWSWKAGVAKPSPRLFAPVLSIMQRRKLAPGQVLYVGNDRLNDVSAAAAAGCRTVLFAGDRRSLRLREGDPRCAGLEPDRTIGRLDELAPMLFP
jgi:putative hydrolase of the HAD superfamily